MKIAIIGAGFTGLTLAYRLSQKGHKIVIVEAENKAGGLAVGFNKKEWKWTLEKHYHHLFTNDKSILGLAKELKQKIITVRPKTSTFYKDNIYQIDSPLALLKFAKLTFFSRIRTGVVLLILKLSPFLKLHQNITSEKFLISFMGQESWKVLWKPLFIKKFHEDYRKISFVWFWARIKKRTPSLCYPEGGFQKFADRIVENLNSNGAEIYFSELFNSFEKKDNKFLVKTSKRKFKVDKIINTQPLKDTGIKMIGAVNLVLELKKPFFQDNTYWLNVNEESFPFLAIVEHTNFMNKKYYNKANLVYIGNYVDKESKLYNMNINEILKIYMPYLIKVNPAFNSKMILGKYLFKAPFAQQIVSKGYYKKIPPFVSKVDGIYNANIQQVYPWDRGTNYAVEIGNIVSELL